MGERYRLLEPDRPQAEVEEEMLTRWAEENLFGQTMRARADAEPWVFFEGPPTANGRPGIHHVFARTIKDLFCRHRAMKGFRVDRKAGWDTHGLPVEIEVEKQLGISGKHQIEELGVERFNALCRESVWKYRAEWQTLSERIGFWLDYENAYVSYTNDYVESVWWALHRLYERQLLYRGHKILPYCPRCGTALSSHEVAQGYKDVVDPSVYLALDLLPGTARMAGAGDAAAEHADGVSPGDRSGGSADVMRRRILVWTTTPWTLVSNTALAVHPELTYVELRKRTAEIGTIILAESRAAAVLGDDYDDRWAVVGTMTGADLAGQRYRRPLDWVEYGEGEHEVILAESFVSASDGTGVVHMSPAFGADDYAAGQRNGLAFVQPVNLRGEFPAGMPLVGGMFVKKADAIIIAELERRGVLWKAGTLEHAYPHCWRCGTPLLYYARTSWFVRTTAFRDQMLARNSRVGWHSPEMGEKRFGEWLVNNIDWAISRDRYWGTPLPVWVCDADETHVESIGSYADLAAKSGAALPADFDPHKPFIDRYEWDCACGGRMRRTPEVIDTWFDSGSMPFAQWHYPFENRDQVESHYPADFIAEGVDQTRGWFYSLLAIATGLGDDLPNNVVTAGGGAMGTGAAPYRNVVVNDLVLDANGVKMSKSTGNAVDPWAVIPRHGVDAIRLFLIVSSQVWIPRRFDEATIRDKAGRFLITLKNIYSGIFAKYANFGWHPSSDDPPVAARPPIDRWVLARLATVEREVDRLLEEFDATTAASLLIEFVDEDLSKWYVRQTRARFYDVESADNRAAFATLHETLVVVCRLLAPFAPFVADWIHRELTGESVHLAPFVREERAAASSGIERAMGHIRTLARLGRAAREEVGIKVRQPLSRVVCVVPGAEHPSLEPLLPLLASELNVKEVTFATSADSLVTLSAKPNFRSLGKKFGKSTPLAAKAVEALSSDALRAFERGEPLAVSVGNESHLLDGEDLIITRHASGDLVVSSDAGYFVAVDPAITPALRREGMARDLISRIQRMRKDAGLAVSDRIIVRIAGGPDVVDVVDTHRDWIASEVLATDIVVGDAALHGQQAVESVDLDGPTARIAITKEDQR
jgi:isoleucyl-tRNA synthetase